MNLIRKLCLVRPVSRYTPGAVVEFVIKTDSDDIGGQFRFE